MKLSQLHHVLRAAADISGEKSFVIVGSQAVLLLRQDLDERLTMSDELDLYPSLAPEKADVIDGAIGVLSQFHDEFGYHADGVGPETAVMPADWMARASFHYLDTLLERIEQLDRQQYPVDTIVAWARRRHRDAQRPNTP